MCLNELQDSYNRIIVINTIFRVVQISLPQGCSATEKTACHPEFFSHRATDLNIYAKEIIFSYDFFFFGKRSGVFKICHIHVSIEFNNNVHWIFLEIIKKYVITFKYRCLHHTSSMLSIIHLHRYTDTSQFIDKS